MKNYLNKIKSKGIAIISLFTNIIRYYIRPGSGSGSSIWTIYLEGGGFCYGTNSVNIIIIII